MNTSIPSFQLSHFSIELMVFALFLVLFVFELILSKKSLALSLMPQLNALQGKAQRQVLLDLMIKEKSFISSLAIMGLSLILGLSFVIDIRCEYDVYVNDAWAIFFKKGILACSILILLVVHQGIKLLSLRASDYLSLLLLSLLGLLLWVSVKDLISWVIALELSSMPLILLTAFEKEEEQVKASFKLYLTAVLSSIFLLLSLSILIGWTGESQFSLLRNQLAAAKPAIIQVALLLFLFASTFKMGLFPSHRWLPDSYRWSFQGTIVYLGTLSKLVSLLAMARLIYHVFPAYLSFLEPYVFLIGVGSLFVGHFGALSQKPSRAMLAYAGIAQGALAWMALFAINSLALGSAIAFGFAYFLAFLLIFLIDMAVLKNKGESDGCYTQLKQYPFFMFCFVLALLSMAGIPPLLGFWTKFYILLGMFKGQQYLFVIIALLSALLSLYYYLTWVKKLLLDQTNASALILDSKTTNISSATYVIAFLLAATLIGFGLFPHLVLNELQQLAQFLIHD